MARYEDALAQARVVRSAAEALNDYTYLAKAFEIEGLAYYHIGRSEVAEVGVRKTLDVLREHGYTVVGPRLEWLLAKILRRRGEDAKAEKLLRSAENQLLKTKDPEDLSGVQIEIQVIRSRNGDPREGARGIESLFRDGEQKRLPVIAVQAALAISEIVHDQRLDHVEYSTLLSAGLEMAEGSGMRESVWQLSYRMGAFAARVGQRKEAYSRFTLASRVLRQIAGDLCDANRQSYISSAHVASAIKNMDVAMSA